MYTAAEIKAAGLDDFRVFLRQVWDFLSLPEPTPVQNDIARYLQRGPRRMIIQGFRGVGKSWLTVAFVCWLLLLNPQIKIMVVSASQGLADDFSKFTKQLIHGMPLLQHLAPRIDQRNSAISFDVGPADPSKDPSVKSAGITGQITGSRADIIVADDIEIPKNSYTHLLRERLAELVKEFDAVLKPGGRIVYLGTPQVEATLYNRMPARGYEIRVWPAEIPQKFEAYSGRLAPYVMDKIERGARPGDALDPVRFDEDDLEERRASYGHSGYALQFMLDTNPASEEKYPLKLKDLIVTDVDAKRTPVSLVWGRQKTNLIEDLPAGGLDGDAYYSPVWRSDEMAEFTGTVMAIDPSGRGKDETAWAIVRFCHGLLYLVDVGGLREGYSEKTLKYLAARALRFGVNKVIIERNYGGGMFDQLLAPHLAKLGAGRIDDEFQTWSTGMKEARILDTLEPVVQSHKLIVDRRVIEEDRKVQEDTPKYSFIQQFTRMERVKGALAHDDRVEAVALACSYWVSKMNRDQQRVINQLREDALDEELRRFMDHAIGGHPAGVSFVSR